MNCDLIFKSLNPICKFRGVGKGGGMVDICCKNTPMKCMVACSVSWLLNRIETGVDFVLLQTLFSPASFLLKSQGIEDTTVQWLNTGCCAMA